MLKIAWEYILANLIALISLAISIYNLWKNRKNITVTYQENIEINFIDGIFVFDSNNEIETYKTTMTIKISIVNPSPNDIGFFDLRVFDPVTNINIPFLTYRTLPFTNKTVIRIVDYKNPKYYELDIPQRKLCF
ncbi:hypothetical protein DS832_07150 [Bombilactobacillus bombi]|uniref:Uncharacterized protein n=1 Tax=Bombilactobacillus bombi TaxID=1303590 RepID=A0A3R6W668_9LACO|nr:hypothetical protein [Bombilactobacillus bombi]RHW46119.1 hypothetical protein DS832_07150 [Bombilactobacillus bombi]